MTLQNTSEYRKIVLVDDDSDDREFFAEAVALVRPGIRVDMKCDGEELMEHLRMAKPLPDLIFLDLNMPRKSGKECLSEIRVNEAFKKIPVVIYSTSLNPVDVEETFNQGASRFFRKPNSFEDLRDALGVLLSPESSSLSGSAIEDFIINNKTKTPR